MTRLIAVIASFCLSLVAFGQPTTGFDIYDLTNPNSALMGFTMKIDLGSRASASFWAACNDVDPTKIYVYDGAGSVRYPVDASDVVPGSETGVIYFKMNPLSSGLQQVRVYPCDSGNASVSAGATYGAYNAYDDYTEAFYPDGAGTDRTANGYDLTSAGNVSPGDSAGPFGKATNYDGTGDYAYTETLPVSAWPVSVSIWVTSDVNTGTHWFATFMDYSNYVYSSLLASDVLNWASWVRNGGSSKGGAGWPSVELGTFTDASWVHMTGVNVANYSHHLYIEEGAGQVSGSSNSLGPWVSTADAFVLGAKVLAGPSVSGEADGRIAQVVISSTDRSADWADYEAQFQDQATFWGSPTWTESGGGGGGTTPVSVMQLYAYLPE